MQYSGYQAPHIVKQWGAYFRSILDVLLGTFDPSPSEIVGCLDKIYFRYCSFNGYDDVQYDIYYVENCRKSLCTPACIYNFSFNFLNLFILCKYMSSGPSAPNHRKSLCISAHILIPFLKFSSFYVNRCIQDPLAPCIVVPWVVLIPSVTL